MPVSTPRFDRSEIDRLNLQGLSCLIANRKQARRLTDEFCARFTQYGIGQHVADWGSVVPHVTSVNGVFYDLLIHHNYQIGTGIDALCARCEDPIGEPTN